MSQPYEIINLRKRMKQSGYKEISIEKQSEVSAIGEEIYKITATTPLGSCQEVKILSVSEAKNILRKHKLVHSNTQESDSVIGL